MSDKKISQLSNAAALTGTEVAPIVQSGSTVKATAQNIANLAIPSQTGNNGKYLTTNGTSISWGTVSAGTPTAIYKVTTNGSGAVTATAIQTISGFTPSFSISAGGILINSASLVATSATFGSPTRNSADARTLTLVQVGAPLNFVWLYCYDDTGAQVFLNSTATSSIGFYITIIP